MQFPNVGKCGIEYIIGKIILRLTNISLQSRDGVIVLVLEYEYFLSTRTRVRRKVIVLVLEYITKVIVLTITFHDYIFFIWTVASK